MTPKGNAVFLLLTLLVVITIVNGRPKIFRNFYDMARTLCKLPGELCLKDKDCCDEYCYPVHGIKYCVHD
ncbi:unnamed protein product [Allacma fusca]|uniref:Uncharacterized protein n=3 Tax=Allacma fusca TaxID=39272 RepID=A0A8J2KH83_9HEXA|nr:unnamed protein product [Allacma fusca]